MVYCGTDIIEVERIKNAILDNSQFLKRVFTEYEINDVEKTKGELRYQRYAARFAAKEAIYKALSKLLTDNKFVPSFLDAQIEKLDVENSRPSVNFINKDLNEIIKKNNVTIDVSLSHIKEYAIAFAVAEI